MRNIDILTDLKEIKETLEGGLVATNISIEDTTNVFTASNVEDALLENKTSILTLQTELGINKTTLEANINAIRKVL